MTQDQAGQGTGYVVRGEVVPGEETEATQAEESGPMTPFKKVASALRGDRADQTADDRVGAMSGPASDDVVDDEEDADATRPNEVRAAQSPDPEGRGYWADEHDLDATVPDEPQAEELSALGRAAVGPDTYATAAPASPVPTSSYGGDTATGLAAAADAGLRPGEATDRLGDFGDIAFGDLLPNAEQYTSRWQQIQFLFVDDPHASVTEAADVVSQVTAKLEAAIQDRQRAIEERQRAIQERASALRGRWGEGTNADTETLRETLRMYRSFMDQLIGTGS
jgi:hypothetical protein